VVIHRAVCGGRLEDSQDARPRVAVDAAGRRRERRGHRRRDGVVAVGEVLIEDLPADTRAGDEVADRDPVDGTFVCQRERRVTQQRAHPFGAGVCTVCAGCHVDQRKSLRRQLTTKT
jgi:hypothetical protein